MDPAWYARRMRLAVVLSAALLSGAACTALLAACVGYLDENVGRGDSPKIDAPVESLADVTAETMADASFDVAVADGTAADSSDAGAGIAAHGIAWSSIPSGDGGTFQGPFQGVEAYVTLPFPSRVEPGDVLIAGLVFRVKNVTAAPTITTEMAGWTLVEEVFAKAKDYLYVYRGSYDPDAGVPRWSITGDVSGVAWLSAYGGVSPTAPTSKVGYSYASPEGGHFVTPTLNVPAGDMVVVSLGGYADDMPGSPVHWTVLPSLQLQVPDDGGPSFGATGDFLVTGSHSLDASPIGYSVTARPALAYGLVQLLALEPK